MARPVRFSPALSQNQLKRQRLRKTVAIAGVALLGLVLFIALKK